MHTVHIPPTDDISPFRAAARGLLAAHIAPQEVLWDETEEAVLFEPPPPVPGADLLVPARFVALATEVARHRDASRWALLYSALWRLAHGERALLELSADPLVHRLTRMQQAVSRDRHRMTAFVRFRAVKEEAGERFVAWYEPAHRVLRSAASFFIDRYAAMQFSILTPDLSLHWDGRADTFSGPVPRQDAPAGDDLEAWWKRYYAATFNPARSNPGLLRSHVPHRFRHNLPEAALIPDLLAQAATRTESMLTCGPLPRPATPD